MAEIVDLSEIYSAEYHAIAGERGEKQYPAKQDMARALDEMFRPKRVIDVGCGRGWWLEYWALNRPEVEIVGLDGCAELIKRNNQCHESIRDKIHSCDLRQPMWWRPWFEEPWDLVLCVEVAEHLPESYARQLVGGLRVLGNRIFFSAAPIKEPSAFIPGIALTSFPKTGPKNPPANSVDASIVGRISAATTA